MNGALSKLPEMAAAGWLERFLRPVCDSAALRSPIPLTEEAREKLCEALMARLLTPSAGALFTCALRQTAKTNRLAMTAPALVPDAARRAGAEEALAALNAAGDTALDGGYPLLRGRLVTICEHFGRAADEMFARIGEQRESIGGRFFGGGRFARILDLSFAGADTHNGGRAAAKVTTDRGAFLYKPHDVRQDVFFRSLTERYFPGTVRVPDCLPVFDEKTGARYGFCEYITNTPAEAVEEAAEYYANLGGFAALTRLFGSTDFHQENLLADRTRPAPVDLETVFTPPFPKADADEPEWYDDIRLSVMQNGMMPTRVDGVYETSPLVSKRDRNLSAPVTDGERQTVFGYFEDYLAGFEKVCRIVMEKKDALRAELDASPDFAVRAVLRPTSYYAKAAALTADREGLNDAAKASERVAARLRHNPNRVPEESWALVRAAEERAIFQEDVPYFYTKAHSVDLYDPEGRVAAGFFRVPPVDAAKERLERFDEKELRFELRIQQELIGRACRPADGTSCADETWTFGTAEELVGKLLSEAVETPSGAKVWFGSPANVMRNVLGAGWYTGMTGTVWALALYRRLHPETAYAEEIAASLEVCRRMMESYVRRYERQTVIAYPEFNPGLSGGCAGVIEGLMRLYRTDGDGRYLALAERLAGVFRRFESRGMSDLTRKTGLAGVLTVLCRYREELNVEDGLLRRFADELMKRKTTANGGRMLWDVNGSARLVGGFDVGIGGVGLALYLAGKALGDGAYLSAAEDAFGWERSCFDPERGGWQDTSKSTVSPERYGGIHSGGAGEGFLWMALGDREMLEKAADDALCAEALFSDRLRDGNPGVCDFLIEAGRELARPELTSKAAATLGEMRKRVRRFTDRGFEPVWEPSLFGGDAGVLYALLRLEAPERVPCLFR